MDAVAVVVAGDRRGGLDFLTPVGGVPMVVRAVHSVLATGFVGHVALLVAAPRREAVVAACSGLPVLVHGGLRRALSRIRPHIGERAGDTTSDGSLTVRFDDVVLLHDATRPMAPSALATVVMEAVRSGHDAVVPVLPLSDTVKQVDVHGLVCATPDRSTLRVLQTPQAFRGVLLSTDLLADPLTAMVAHAAAGGTVHTVPGHPMAFSVNSAWDLELAELLVGGVG